MGSSGDDPKSFELTLDGVVTVFDAFSISSPAIRFQIGEKSVNFQSDARGQAKADGAALRIKNGGQYGVGVRGVNGV